MRASAPREPDKPPGAFVSDGSYSEKGELRHRGHIDRLIRAMVRERREGRLTPELAANAIGAANATAAFPSWERWLDRTWLAPGCMSWPLMPAHTAAETAVKYEGRLGSGHWCGERYAEGPEGSCPEERHRDKSPAPEAHRTALQAMFGAFEQRT